MVGLVLVSHSEKLAQGLKDMVLQMTHRDLSVEIASGTSVEDAPLGTDPTKVLLAMEKAEQGDGVIVFMDVGSALMSAETAYDLLSDDQQKNVYLSPAPIIEGTIIAAVQAALGSDLQKVADEADQAAGAKRKQLGFDDAPVNSSDILTPKYLPKREDSEEKTIVIPNKLGLHARPAARIVQTLEKYTASLWLLRGADVVSAKSLNQIAMLAIKQGEKVTFRAAGVDAKDALAAIETLAKNNFGDEDLPDYSLREALANGDGIPVSSGAAFGPVVIWHTEMPVVNLTISEDPNAEIVRLAEAIAVARIDLGELERTTASNVDSAAEAEFFALHAMLLDDPYITCTAHDLMTDNKYNAEAAWAETIRRTMERYKSLSNEYVRGRASDVLDVGIRVLRALNAEEYHGMELNEPSIIIAHDMGPSDMVSLDKEKVLGIVTAEGGITSHVAVFARAMQIPAIVNVENILTRVQDGDSLGFNGDSGEIWVNPDSSITEVLQHQREQWAAEVDRYRKTADRKAVTKDGRTITVLAAVNSVEEARKALESGADGIGSYLTETFVYFGREPMSEDEQYAVYCELGKLLDGEPLIVRTDDFRGQKKTGKVATYAERGVQFSLSHKEIFMAQLRALLRANTKYPLKILLPMVKTATEVKKVHALISQARKSLEQEGVAVSTDIGVGAMIETPSAGLLEDQIARVTDFMVLGCDDLTAQTLLIDRNDPKVGRMYGQMHPAIMRVVQRTQIVADQQKIPMYLTGQILGNPYSIPVLLGLGVTTLVAPLESIVQVKESIRGVIIDEARSLAEQVLSLPDAQSVRAFMKLNAVW